MPYRALSRKLGNFLELDHADLAWIEGLSARVRSIPRRTSIISQGDEPNYVHLVLQGWAARSKSLVDGSRQITGFLIPGDFCDLHVTILGQMDHSIIALDDCVVAYVEAAEINDLANRSPRLTQALWWATLVDEAVLREWVVNNGRRAAYPAIAHLFCEMHARMRMVGLTEDDRIRLPLSQEELADATGLTPVHVNRVLRRLRSERLVEVTGRFLDILDVTALRDVAGFDPAYLHLRRAAPA